jgi:hypothetical protein
MEMVLTSGILYEIMVASFCVTACFNILVDAGTVCLGNHFLSLKFVRTIRRRREVITSSYKKRGKKLSFVANGYFKFSVCASLCCSALSLLRFDDLARPAMIIKIE